MNAFYYWLIVAGVVCIGINVNVNGIQFILPTCIGYALISIAAWNLRDEDFIYRYVPIPASILAILSVPDLFRAMIIPQTDAPSSLYLFDLWTYYPYSVLHIALFAAIAIAITRQARKYEKREIFKIAIVTAIAVVVFEIPRFFLPFSSHSYLIAFFVVTTLYHVLLVWTFAWAATRFP